MNQIVVVSPHRDDAAFSCAIAIRYLKHFAPVTVANLFTVSEYAPFRQDASASVTEIRRQEDEAYSLLAGCRLADLNLVDAPQRLKIDMAHIASERPFNAGDQASLDAISAHLVNLSADLLLLPLALGNHIDHRIAQHAARQTKVPAMCFYEDLPYTARLPEESAAQRAQSLRGDLQPWIVTSEDALEWKARCAALYGSQIDAATVKEIADFADRYEGGERLWITPQAYERLSQLSR